MLLHPPVTTNTKPPILTDERLPILNRGSTYTEQRPTSCFWSNNRPIAAESTGGEKI